MAAWQGTGLDTASRRLGGPAGSKETAALWEVNAALRNAEDGRHDLAKQAAISALTLSSGREVKVTAALRWRALAISSEPRASPRNWKRNTQPIP